MASSNRHWPSMFKSKPHQWQHEPNSSLMSTGCHRSSFSSGCEERTPEPKPRWNPKPEQIRILEAIFDSGMVNPPRDEIRKIRAQLQEYGQVGDANVFYWFQNRKSRSKHKLRHLQNSKQRTTTTPPASNSSSSSSENKSSPKSGVGGSSSGLTKSCTSNVFTLGPSTLSDVSNNNIPTFSLSPPPYFPVSQDEILTEQFIFPGHGFFLPEATGASGMVHFHGQPLTGPCGTVLMSELMSHGASKKVKINNSTTTTTTTPTSSIATTTSASTAYTVAPTSTVSSPVTVPFLSSITQNHGGGARAIDASGGAAVVEARTTVFINDVAFELAAESFSIRGTFGDDAVLVNAAGQPVLTDEWGVTLQPLQHGAFYYLI